jgi:hypothetical protein
MFFYSKINSPFFNDWLVYKSQFITVQHTSGHVKVSTVYDHHVRPTLLNASSV